MHRPNLTYDVILFFYDKINVICDYSLYLCNILMSALELKQICDIMETKLNRIKVVLVEKSISQKELAAKIGKSFSTVNAYCANRQQPTLETLDQIARVLNVPMRTLIKED